MSGHDDHDEFPRVDARIAEAAHSGCAESRLLMTRRSMLGVTAALFTSAFLPDFAKAATDPEARFFIVVLRGGMDGIGMLVPKLDPLYESARRQLALPFSQTLSLGSDFALHPSLARLHAMFNAGEAAFVPAAGIPLRNRSHFECQDNLENGLPVNTVSATGWLNRLLGSLPAGDPIRVKRGIEIGEAPLILRGPEPVLGWSPTWFDKAHPDNIRRLRAVFSAVDPSLWSSLSRGIAADQLALASGAGTGEDISVLRKGFIGAARLMRAEAGPRIAVLSVGGWDTHTQQGGLTGQFNDRLVELDQALGDLKAELGTAWAKTVTICVTEFGRTVITNGDNGTDHGIGTVAILAGGAVRGGFIGDWPGLAPENLLEGDLRPTVDLRGVFKGILRDHLAIPAGLLDTTVFPDSASAVAVSGLVATPAPTFRSAGKVSRLASPQELSPIALYRQQYGL